MEHGRAVLFTGPTRYRDPALHARLVRCGRLDLWDRWVAAVAALDEAHRRQYDPVQPAGPVRAGGLAAGPAPVPPVSAATASTTPEQAAWNEYDDATRAVAGVIGEALGPSLPPYDELRARIGEQVVVYVGSASLGGEAALARWGAQVPDRRPHHWAAFSLTGT